MPDTPEKSSVRVDDEEFLSVGEQTLWNNRNSPGTKRRTFRSRSSRVISSDDDIGVSGIPKARTTVGAGREYLSLCCASTPA